MVFYQNLNICHLGYQYGEEFGKINVLRKAPAIKDGDFCLAERYVVYGIVIHLI